LRSSNAWNGSPLLAPSSSGASIVSAFVASTALKRTWLSSRAWAVGPALSTRRPTQKRDTGTSSAAAAAIGVIQLAGLCAVQFAGTVSRTRPFPVSACVPSTAPGIAPHELGGSVAVE
jgi:hypothetical protein